MARGKSGGMLEGRERAVEGGGRGLVSEGEGGGVEDFEDF